MPSWWGKSSSKDEKKKANKESFIDVINRKFRTASEEKSNSRSGGSRRCCNDTVSDRGSPSRILSISTSPSTLVSRCQSFNDRPHAQPLPLPASVGCTDSGIGASSEPGFDRGSKPFLFIPVPKPVGIPSRLDHTDANGDLGTASVSSDSSIDSDDASDSRLLSPLTSDYENGNRTAVSSPLSILHKDHSPIGSLKNSRETWKPANQSLSTSPRRESLGSHVQNLQIPCRFALCSPPNSSMSSPSRSPMSAFGAEQGLNSGLWTAKPYSEIALLGSGHCSSPGSGHNSGHNSVGGDMPGQLFWPHSRCSPECSPIPSPRMTSPGPSSRIHSGAVTPLHPRAGGATPESPTSRPDDGKQQGHRLPLPPITICNTCPFSPTYSTTTSPSVPRSPGRTETPTSPGSRWKKGRLLGRGTFGHVYLGFNSESGEMCAMKEVTLFSDDAKSRESVQQLGQEIALLSRLRHPNIVQYYGSETIDDKLYIYLEYVSGGSIYKLLQEYGQFGESAIRSYTQQILSGLAYLHAKNTVHRDIKGANILVDPNGRVKLADFGMAKHITGHSCPLSFKGSPYWMAPEVIKNSNGSNLAVDIWSLGCTVLEMATTKPPWSQYEGVAALFKIGNSKELPEIPVHLSEEAKDFVRKCLQRNPLHRPTAAQLLEHHFVKNAAPVDRPVPPADPPETQHAVTNTMRTLGIGHARNSQCCDPEGVATHHLRRLKTGSGHSDFTMPRNTSCPISPIGSPILHSRSPQQMSGRLSPSPISSPHTASGSSTPLTGDSGAMPFHHPKQPITYLHEGIDITARSQSSFYGGGNYQEPIPERFRGMCAAAHVFPELIAADNGVPGNQFGRPCYGDLRELYDGPPVFDHLPQQLLSERLKFKQSLHLNPNLSIHGRTNGI